MAEATAEQQPTSVNRATRRRQAAKARQGDRNDGDQIQFHQQLNHENPPTKNIIPPQRVERRGDRDDGDSDDDDDGSGSQNTPRRRPSIPKGAKYASAGQVCDRYGGRSDMWLWRKVKDDKNFPKPYYMGRKRLFLVEELDAYDRSLIQKAVIG